MTWKKALDDGVAPLLLPQLRRATNIRSPVGVSSISSGSHCHSSHVLNESRPIRSAPWASKYAVLFGWIELELGTRLGKVAVPVAAVVGRVEPPCLLDDPPFSCASPASILAQPLLSMQSDIPQRRKRALAQADRPRSAARRSAKLVSGASAPINPMSCASGVRETRSGSRHAFAGDLIEHAPAPATAAIANKLVRASTASRFSTGGGCPPT